MCRVFFQRVTSSFQQFNRCETFSPRRHISFTKQLVQKVQTKISCVPLKGKIAESIKDDEGRPTDCVCVRRHAKEAASESISFQRGKISDHALLRLSCEIEIQFCKQGHERVLLFIYSAAFKYHLMKLMVMMKVNCSMLHFLSKSSWNQCVCVEQIITLTLQTV